MQDLLNVAGALADGAPLREVLASAISAAALAVREQEKAVKHYREARGAQVNAETEHASTIRLRAQVAAQITKSAASEGRNEAERKALAADALAGNEGYQRLDATEAANAESVRVSEGEVDGVRESLRLGQARLSLINGILASVAALAAVESGRP